MRNTRTIAIAIAIVTTSLIGGILTAQLTTAASVPSNAIEGVVTSPSGPVAGVWVIAETADLGTRFVKIVVTDDQGRYVLPDLPGAGYAIWVRGYGLVDSAKVTTKPGSELNLTAVLAPDARAAAQYYPAGYWFAMLRPPGPSEFPGTGDSGNGINPNMASQAQWIRQMKTGSCDGCHSIGDAATHIIEPSLGHFETSVESTTRAVPKAATSPGSTSSAAWASATTSPSTPATSRKGCWS